METLRTASGNVTLARDACFPASWIRRISALADVARLCTDIGQPLGLEAVFLVVPLEWADFAALGGYARLLDPTLRTVQEGQLREVTARMAAVVFPAVQPVSAGTRVRLGRRRDG